MNHIYQGGGVTFDKSYFFKYNFFFRKVIERITGENKRKIADLEFELEKLKVLYEKEKEEMKALGGNEMENVRNLHEKVKSKKKKK